MWKQTSSTKPEIRLELPSEKDRATATDSMYRKFVGLQDMRADRQTNGRTDIQTCWWQYLASLAVAKLLLKGCELVLMRMLFVGVPIITTTVYVIARAHHPEHSAASVSHVSVCVCVCVCVIVLYHRWRLHHTFLYSSTSKQQWTNFVPPVAPKLPNRFLWNFGAC